MLCPEMIPCCDRYTRFSGCTPYLQTGQQPLGSLRDDLHCFLEDGGIVLSRAAKARDLPDILEGGSPDFLAGSGL